MSEVEPMRGRRVKKARCTTEGHAVCDVTRSAEPLHRTAETTQWRSEIDEET